MSKHKKNKKHDDKKVVKKEKLQPAIQPEPTKIVHVGSADHSLQDDAKKLANDATTKAKEFAHQAEEKIDEVTAKAKTYIEGQGKKDFEEIKQETVSKTNKVAEGVEHIGEGYEDIIESIFPDDHTGPRITYEAERKEDVDRWAIIRLLRGIILWPVMVVRGAWISLIWIVYIVKIIMTGKRDRILRDKMIRFANYVLNWDAYMGGLIDRRPEIVE